MRALGFLTLILIKLALFAQSSDEQLAAQYYSNGEYEKAVVLYKKIYKEDPNSIYIYENYLNCLIALKEDKDAISLVKKQIRRYDNSLNYKVDLGFVYESLNEAEKAEEYFDDLIRDYENDQRQISQLAQSFLRRRYTERAIQCFERGIEVHGYEYYWSSLLNLYRITGEYKKATDLGLKVLFNDKRMITNIRYQFIQLVEDETAAEYIQEETMKYAQNYPDKTVFDELLMNVYLQQKKFNAAYRQANAMDLRLKEDGRRLLNLAEICISNKAYEVAEKCYRAILAKGDKTMYYVEAEVGLLNTLYHRVTEEPKFDQNALTDLVQRYEKFIVQYGKNPTTSYSMKRLSELYLKYTHETDKAIATLNDILLIPRTSNDFKGECKLLLGDAYLISGDIWESKLLYGQVDKEFKEDALGQEAKFRSARLSYFTGDFDWAKSQLEILKTATSQLIANNALDLALLIQDNTGLDTTEDAMKDYAHAEFLLFQNKTDECMQLLNQLPFKYSQHSLTDEILFLKAKVMEKKHDFNSALEFYRQVYEGFAFDILADNALFKAASIYQDVIGDQLKAKELYEKIILDHTSSLFVVESRKRYNEINEVSLP